MNGRLIQAAALVLVTVTVAACADKEAVTRQQRELQALQDRLTKVEAALADRKGATLLEQQERCARQAAVAFRQLGHKLDGTASYENHFNTKSGRCLIDISSASVVQGQVISERTVLDAFEMKEYGATMRVGMEVPPKSCELLNDEGYLTECDKIGTTTFAAYVKRLMTE